MGKKKKVNVSKARSTKVSSAEVASAAPSINAPPNVTVPKPPSGFVPVPLLAMRGGRPTQVQLASFRDAIVELQDFGDYAEVLGSGAPPVDSMVQQFQDGLAWASFVSDSEAWLEYVKSQDARTWKDALVVLDKLRTAFRFAAATNPALLTKYPAITRSSRRCRSTPRAALRSAPRR